MIARRLRSESGWALVTAMMVIALMTTIGLATYSVIDTQTRQSGNERNRESQFYLADAALNEEAFLLSRDWPSDATRQAPATCSTTTVNEFCPAGNGAWRSAFNTPDYGSSTWTIQVSDDDSSTSFYPGTGPSHPPYDQNNNGLLWVTAISTAHNLPRRVVAEVRIQRVDLSFDFPHNVITAGWFESTNQGNKVIVDTQGQNSSNPAPLKVRCNHRGNGCLDYRAGQVSPDTSTIGYNGGNALSDTAIAELKQAAQQRGTLYQTCPPTLTGLVVYIVNANCVYRANSDFNSATSPGALVVENGTLELNGTSTFYGVIYMVNRSNSPGTVFTTQGNASVQGSVAIDGSGGADAGSSKLNVNYDPHSFNALQGAGQAGIVQNSWRELLNR